MDAEGTSVRANELTREDVVAKFEELHAKYDLNNKDVYMTTIIPDSIAASFIETVPSAIWKQKHKYTVSDKVPILSATVEVEVFGHNFEVELDRPYKPHHRCEFEDYFGFGGHCGGYTDKRIIACFPRTSNSELNFTELLLTATAAPTGDAIDDAYVKRALALLVLGGYVKFWDAYYEFSAWFSSFNDNGRSFSGANVKAKDVILPYIFDHMVPLVPLVPLVPDMCKSTDE